MSDTDETTQPDRPPQSKRIGPLMNRRQFAALASGLAAWGLLPRSLEAALPVPSSTLRLSRRARQVAGRQGKWQPTHVEGAIPRDLNGTFYRVAPGQDEKFGVTLKHRFDGDPFFSAFRFEGGRLQVTARYLATPEYLAEQQAGRMLFHEFGTLAPASANPDDEPPRFKNSPSVNVIRYDGRLLGLSEGGPPTALDPVTLEYQGFWHFHGTLPSHTSFTAHPKFDLGTGEGFAWGVHQGDPMELRVFRMKGDGRLETLHRVPLSRYAMIHDMAFTRHYLVFAVPPVYFDFSRLFMGEASLADVLRFAEREPLRYLILRRDGTGDPVWIEAPTAMVFHNGNAYEDGGHIVLDSVLSPDDSVLRLLYAASKERLPEVTSTRLARVRLDPRAGRLVRRDRLDEWLEFPRFDERRASEDVRFLYSAGEHRQDPLGHDRLNAFDLHRGKKRVVTFETHQTIEESVHVPKAGGARSEAGWLLTQGYDGRKNENFLDVRDALSLERVARIWLGTHLPLGFHGNFVG